MRTFRTSEKGLGSWFGWGSGVGSAVHCSGVTSDNGPAVKDHAVTSRNCVLDPRKNEALDVVTSKTMLQRNLKYVLCDGRGV